MPTFSRSLEQSLHRALALANERHHEYATLEHLLLALVDDQDAAAVMRACNVDIDKLRRNLVTYVESELENLVTDGSEESKQTAGFWRVFQRAVIHVMSLGRDEVTGANVLVAIFAERESRAAFLLREQGMARSDGVNYIGPGRDLPLDLFPRDSRARAHAVDAREVDGVLDFLEATFQSPMWEQLSQQERIRLAGRLSHIMEIVERRDLKE
jgi:ATP-dependent Clp protease ATP-binding subunit ClpA